MANYSMRLQRLCVPCYPYKRTSVTLVLTRCPERSS